MGLQTPSARGSVQCSNRGGARHRVRAAARGVGDSHACIRVQHRPHVQLDRLLAEIRVISEIRPPARGSGRRSSAAMLPSSIEGPAAKSAPSPAPSAGSSAFPLGPPRGPEPRVLCSPPRLGRRRAGAEAEGARVWHRPAIPLRRTYSSGPPGAFFRDALHLPHGHPPRAGSVRGYSSVGRAPGSHPGGRGFESPSSISKVPANPLVSVVPRFSGRRTEGSSSMICARLCPLEGDGVTLCRAWR